MKKQRIRLVSLFLYPVLALALVIGGGASGAGFR